MSCQNFGADSARARISRVKLVADRSLSILIHEGERRAQEERKTEVGNAVAALRRRGIRPSIRSVATYLGGPEWLIQKNPELTRIVKLSLGAPGGR